MDVFLGFAFAAVLAGGALQPQNTADASGPLVRCMVPPFTGAARPQGVTTTMTVVSDGQPCAIFNFGVPVGRQNPATAGVITQAPAHGKAEFVAPRVPYTAEPGFVGADEFAFLADATAPNGAPMALRVRVRVDVRAARFAQSSVEPPPIRIGAGVTPPQRIKNVNPVYPPAAQSARAQGVVIIEATIGSDGKVRDALVVRSIPLLDAAALTAVRQWEYTPTILDGRAVPVIMTVTVNFTLDSAGPPAPPPTGVLPSISSLPSERRGNTDFESGRRSLESRRFEEALQSFRRANDALGRRCAECFYGMALAFEGLGASKNVVESCERALDFIGDDRRFVVTIRQTKGIALQRVAELKDEKRLREAEAEFRAALALDPDAPSLHFHLGIVLMQEFRDLDGIGELKRELALRPTGANADFAKRLIVNPRRAREAYAPEFAIVTLSRELLELPNLRGKVVVLAFWGTWCTQCVPAMGWLKDIQKMHAKDPFVMIGVGGDADGQVIREFVSRNQMDWPQFWDQGRRLSQLYDVRIWPTYIVIDDEGIVRFRGTGPTQPIVARLGEEVRRALKTAAARLKSQ